MAVSRLAPIDAGEYTLDVIAPGFAILQHDRASAVDRARSSCR